MMILIPGRHLECKYQALAMESRHCFMCKINAPISFYYVLFLFRYGLSYLVMWSLRMIMCTFCLVEWSYNLIVRSLYLVMCTSHLVIISYFWLCALIIWFFLFSYALLSFHYVLFPLSALFMRSLYVLFVYALWMSSFHDIFHVVWELKN